ncbi:MAG: SDR family NAD(P)-dependent oxidoreductase [Myxococcales bacterium]|nr:SDR family NAD(P)-dependent oxidoreductase [Myxococcales bacterium]MCB9531323.1 SDR family NAD(P)-dependent oxidoreductase [Myxococcales bacterium]
MTDLVGRTFVVTGASSGIGRATAVALGRRGATVALVARASGRLRAAADEVAAAHPDATARVITADLSTAAGAAAAADALRADLGDIDVLINNVGAVFPERETTTDGLEQTFALNHFGVFVLTCRLLTALRTGSAPRVVTVSSQVHSDRLDLDDLQLERRYGGLEAYRRSKLMNLLFSSELHRRHGDWLFTGALHPGVVDTPLLSSYGRAADLEREAARGAADAARGPARRVLSSIARRVTGSGASVPSGIAPTDGAKTSVMVAASAEALAHPGAYWRDCAVARPHAAAEDAALAARLWAATAALAARAGVEVES